MTQKQKHQTVIKIQTIIERRQLLIFDKQYLASSWKNVPRAKNALRDNLSLEGFVNVQKELLNTPVLNRQSSLAIGIQKMQGPPEQR